MKNYILLPLLFICFCFALNRSTNAQTAEEHFELGQKMAKEGKLEDAIKNFKAAIKLKPKEIVYYTNRATAYEKMRLYDDAANDYTTAINLSPDDDRLIVSRSMVYMSQKKYYWAVKEFNRAIKLNPNQTEYYKLRESAYRAIENAKKNRQGTSR